MQDRFVGDIGDFGKYGLLRALTGIHPALPPKERLSLGVVWYRNKVTNGGVNEGQSVGYLFDPQSAPFYRDLDPDLFACLKKIVCGRRNVDEIESSKILGENEDAVTFHGDFVPKGHPEREEWFNSALDHIEGKDVVFLDPDTGIIPKFPKDCRKHIFLPEVDKIVNSERCQTIIAYQHYGRDPKGCESQMQQWRAATRKFPGSPRVLSTSQRAFIILPAKDHVERIDDRLCEITQLWSKTSQRAFIILPAKDHDERINDRLRKLTQLWSKYFFQIAL